LAEKTTAIIMTAVESRYFLRINGHPHAGADSEVCDYGTSRNAGYDELGRLIRVNCMNGATPVWGQNFSYDMSDNLSKSVPSGQTGVTWQPGYNSANNRYTLAGATYDANGNLLTDTFHTYVWNQDNHVAQIDTHPKMTYDAFGRMVEKYNGSVYYQKMLSPIGVAAWMQGQTVSQYRVSLPGGDTAVNGTDFERIDYLGNVPFVSSKGRTFVASRLFAPYGETYNDVGNSGYLIFTGDRQDLVAGIYDTPNRELNPTQGRWISPDPAGASWNAYQYSTNPMGETDPSGLSSISCGDGSCQHGWRHIYWGNPGGMPTYGWSAMEDRYGTIQDLAMGNTGVIGNSPSQFVQGGVLLPVGMTPTTGTVTATGYVNGVATPEADQPISLTEALFGIKGIQCTCGDVGNIQGLVGVGTLIYRVFGGKSPLFGKFWTTVDPSRVPDYRGTAGLPEGNSGQLLAQGQVTSTAEGITQSTATAVEAGQTGGLNELIFENPEVQIQIMDVLFMDPPL
jgi:RHS repeat-associated protein